MGGAAKTAARRKIFRCTTSARVADWETMSKRISLHSARAVTEPGIFIAKQRRTSRDSDRAREYWK
jgi:hypothetical protein